MTPKFFIGAKIGELSLLRKVRANKKLSANLKVRWKCRCVCGKELVVPEYYMRRASNPKRHCGCQNKSIKTDFNQEYRIWLMMHQRCFNPKHDAFKHYGGRGITIHISWRRTKYGGKDEDEVTAFERFLKYIGPRKSKKFSVDRIDVDGNYEPGNVKWATAKEQAANKRPAKR